MHQYRNWKRMRSCTDPATGSIQFLVEGVSAKNAKPPKLVVPDSKEFMSGRLTMSKTRLIALARDAPDKNFGRKKSNFENVKEVNKENISATLNAPVLKMGLPPRPKTIAQKYHERVAASKKDEKEVTYDVIMGHRATKL